MAESCDAEAAAQREVFVLYGTCCAVKLVQLVGTNPSLPVRVLLKYVVIDGILYLVATGVIPLALTLLALRRGTGLKWFEWHQRTILAAAIPYLLRAFS